MEIPPAEKRLQTTSFVIHATRGVIRDQATRRKAMVILLVIALALLFAGTTILQSFLNPHEHPLWFILFWLICAWLAVTAVLLAVFDLLMVKSEARKAERTLREGFAQSQTQDSPRSTTQEQSGLAKPFGVDE
jgi:cytochrome bd-type quinol oxidase subunit 2